MKTFEDGFMFIMDHLIYMWEHIIIFINIPYILGVFFALLITFLCTMLIGLVICAFWMIGEATIYDLFSNNNFGNSRGITKR